MNRKQYLLLVALTVVSGLIGGAVSNRVFMARSAVAQSNNVLEVEMLRIVDENGMPKISFMIEDGEPKMVFIGKECRAGAHLSIQNGNVSLALKDDNGRFAILGVAELGFMDQNGKVRLALGLAEESTALLFMNRSGKIIAHFGQLPQLLGKPEAATISIGFWDNNIDATRMLLGQNQEGDAFMTFKNELGKPVIAIGAGKEEAGLVLFQSLLGSEIFSGFMRLQDGSVRIEIKDILGNAVWSAP